MEESGSITSKDEEISVSYGACLASARESLGLTQDAVAKQLYLSRNTIEEIEQQAFHPSVAAVYRRGYVASYARFLGLDESAVLETYDSTVPPKKNASFFESTFMTQSNQPLLVRLLKRTSPLYALLLLVLITVLLLTGVVRHFSRTNYKLSSNVVPVTHGHASLTLPKPPLPTASVQTQNPTPVKQQSLALPKKNQEHPKSIEKDHLVAQATHKATAHSYLKPSYTVTRVG